MQKPFPALRFLHLSNLTADTLPATAQYHATTLVIFSLPPL